MAALADHVRQHGSVFDFCWLDEGPGPGVAVCDKRSPHGVGSARSDIQVLGRSLATGQATEQERNQQNIDNGRATVPPGSTERQG